MSRILKSPAFHLLIGLVLIFFVVPPMMSAKSYIYPPLSFFMVVVWLYYGVKDYGQWWLDFFNKLNES